MVDWNADNFQYKMSITDDRDGVLTPLFIPCPNQNHSTEDDFFDGDSNHRAPSPRQAHFVKLHEFLVLLKHSQIYMFVP
jgi:hypothetical protein